MARKSATRICAWCGTERARDSFSRNGIGRPRTWCRECDLAPERPCARCKRRVPRERFYADNQTGRLKTVCVECSVEPSLQLVRDSLVPERACTKCGQIRPIEQYALVVRGRPARRRMCKSCTKTRDAKRWAAKEGRTDDRAWAYRLRAVYNLTPDDFYTMLAVQGGGCAICGREEGRTGQRLHVDHCHVTGVVRGILCHICNAGLGVFGDDTEKMRAAIAYLEHHRRTAYVSVANGA